MLRWTNPASRLIVTLQGMAVGRPGSPADSASLQDDVLRIILGLVFR